MGEALTLSAGLEAEAPTYTSIIIALLGVMRFRSQTASHLERPPRAVGNRIIATVSASQNSVPSAQELRCVFKVHGRRRL